MQELAVVPRDSLPPAYGERGYSTSPARTFSGRGGLAIALRLCRDGDTSLAQHVRRVPDDFLAVAVRLSDREAVRMVSCPCGVAQMAGNGLVECSGGCSRWYVGDESGVWAIRLPEQAA